MDWRLANEGLTVHITTNGEKHVAKPSQAKPSQAGATMRAQSISTGSYPSSYQAGTVVVANRAKQSN